ncbi:TerC family protein [Actinoplanes sp. NPDC026619]|uniref:TerC family protein n=1 Tax=Actinoplanes sp. NPDC026619 TaxID=3155798 RepID=UPI0034002929
MPREPTVKESALWALAHAAAAVLFGVLVWAAAGGTRALEFYTGWLAGYALTFDSVLVFAVIMARSAVPGPLRSRVLFSGVALALALRGVLIAVGAVLIAYTSWVLAVFGVFLLSTVFHLLRRSDDEDEFREGILARWFRKVVPIPAPSGGDGPAGGGGPAGGERGPVLVAVVAFGFADLVFALDSTAATFGVTTVPWLVLAITVFALSGFRHLYFLLYARWDRLIYLNAGVALVLAFIGTKMVLEAMPWAPEIPAWVSALVVAGTLAVAVLASLLMTGRNGRRETASVDIALFVGTAVASGVVGNAAYDGLKHFLPRYLRRKSARSGITQLQAQTIAYGAIIKKCREAGLAEPDLATMTHRYTAHGDGHWTIDIGDQRSSVRFWIVVPAADPSAGTARVEVTWKE